MTSLLTIKDLGAAAVRQILDLSQSDRLGQPLAGKGVALLFEKPSARTRNSTEMAVVQLGGHPIYIQGHEVGVGERESAEDVARTLACYHQLIAARVKRHELLEDMAAATDTPILNLLSDRHHPLQALADLLTVQQLNGRLEGAKIAYLGDADNNVCRSLAEGCSLTGAELRIASPQAYQLPASEVEALEGVVQTTDPAEAVDGAQIVYTDVWVSMGQDDEAQVRHEALAPYQVSQSLMDQARDAWFLHCLPARRGEEVTGDVIDGARSAVWRQAENRMHSVRGAMAWMLGIAA